MQLDYTKAENELNTYVVSLDSDPSSIALNRLHEKVATCRTYLARIRVMAADARKNLRDKEREVAKVASEYKKEANAKMGEDRIKILKTIGQQNALIELELVRKIEEKATAEDEYNKALDYYNTVKEAYVDLINTHRAIRDQIHIIDQQITIGEVSFKDSLNKKESKMRLKVGENTIAKEIGGAIINGETDDGF